MCGGAQKSQSLQGDTGAALLTPAPRDPAHGLGSVDSDPVCCCGEGAREHLVLCSHSEVQAGWA